MKGTEQCASFIEKAKESIQAVPLANTGNESAIFHEALHGFTGLYDSTLLSAFGYSQRVGTCNIGVEIQQLLQYSPGLNTAKQPCE